MGANLNMGVITARTPAELEKKTKEFLVVGQIEGGDQLTIVHTNLQLQAVNTRGEQDLVLVIFYFYRKEE